MIIQENNEILNNQESGILIPNVQLGELFVQIIYNNMLIDGFFISNYGRAYNIYTRRYLSQSSDKDGYLRINIKVNGVFKTVKVHRIMLMSFYPIMNPENYVCNHKDGIKWHNWIWNLEWCTVMDNTRHGWDTGLNPNKGEGNIKTYLKDEDINFICKKLEEGKKPYEICDELDIINRNERSRISAIISGIKLGKSYRHISSNYNIPGLGGRTRYSEDFAMLVCNFLEKGDEFTYLEIMDKLQIPKQDRLIFKTYINDLLNGRTAKNITKDYNIKKPKEDKIEDFYY